MARISKFIHIVIFEYLPAREIFRMCTICRSINHASKDSGVWERFFSDQVRMRRLIEEEKEKESSKNYPNYQPKTVKELLKNDVNVVLNLTTRKRFLSYNLVGHNKMISALDIKRGLVVSGGYDYALKVWDI